MQKIWCSGDVLLTDNRHPVVENSVVCGYNCLLCAVWQKTNSFIILDNININVKLLIADLRF